MVHWCGQKPSGKEVSIRLGYALGLRTDYIVCQVACPRFAKMRDACVLICCFFIWR